MTTRITDTVSGRITFLEKTGPMELSVWQSMGKFHRVRMTNTGTLTVWNPANREPQWLLKLVSKHASAIRSWYGFTDKQRADVPWESYERA